jgi:excisionase family DNA binding protein
MQTVTTTRRDPSEALTVSEAAKALGVAPRTVKRMPARDLPYFTVGAMRHRRYRRRHVEAYIRDRTLGL